MKGIFKKFEKEFKETRESVADYIALVNKRFQMYEDRISQLEKELKETKECQKPETLK